MSQNNAEEASVKVVFDLLSSTFQDTYDGLLKVLHEEPNYRHLLKIGERQFFDAPNESKDAQSQKSRFCFVATNFLAMQVDDDIDKIIQEKFQGEFLDNLKADVLKAVLQFSPDDVNSYETAVKASTSQIKPEKEVSAPNKKLNNNCAKKTVDTKKQSSKVNDIQAGPSLDDANDSDLDLSCFSFESVSSVHTSDLSSFEDEITLSSDEECGEKSRRYSLKEIQEKFETDVIVKTEKTEDDEKGKSMQVEETQSASPLHNNEISNTPQKSQRRRKPNLKYTIDNVSDIDDIILMPSKKQSLKKVSSLSRSVCGDAPRKRGRPRKSSS